MAPQCAAWRPQQTIHVHQVTWVVAPGGGESIQYTTCPPLKQPPLSFWPGASCAIQSSANTTSEVPVGYLGVSKPASILDGTHPGGGGPVDGCVASTVRVQRLCATSVFPAVSGACRAGDVRAGSRSTPLYGRMAHIHRLHFWWPSGCASGDRASVTRQKVIVYCLFSGQLGGSARGTRGGGRTLHVLHACHDVVPGVPC